MKKNVTKSISLMLGLGVMTTAALVGCSNSEGKESTSTTPVTSTAQTDEGETIAEIAATKESSAEEDTSQAETEPNGTAIEALELDADGNVTITDMAGREVTFPANPKVWNSSPTCEGWLCAIAPEQIIGWASGFNEQQLSYWPASVAGLETLGGNFGNNEANVEGILAVSPDIIINTFDVSESALQSTIASADAMAEQYGIPVIVVSNAIEDTAEAAGFLGQVLGQPERGAEVQDYLQSVMDKIQNTIAAVPEEKIPTYYYAEAQDGLSTESEDSVHVGVYRYCGLKAAVGEDVTMTNFGGMEAVSLEQVLLWNPDYIFVWNEQAYQSILSDEAWSDITAVQNGNVYLNPSLPQNWVDRSPNSLRILGCLYTAAVCYEDYCTYDLDEEVKGFFEKMYGVELTEEQLSALY